LVKKVQMKYAHLIKLNVFSKEGEDENRIKEKLLSFLTFKDLEKEKIKLEQKTATGFGQKTIGILEITLTKEKHTNAFIENLKEKLNNEQKELILKQAESRLDENLDFFLRFDKEKLINEDKLWLTDSGNCFHIKISIAAFPRKRENGLEIINKLFTIM